MFEFQHNNKGYHEKSNINNTMLLHLGIRPKTFWFQYFLGAFNYDSKPFNEISIGLTR